MRIAAIIGFAALCCGAADAACVARGDAETLAVATLPVLLDATATRCTALGAPAPTASALAVRHRAEGSAAWPRARGLIGQVVPGADILANLDERQVHDMMVPILGEKLGEKLTAPGCALVERSLAAIAPLPAQNLAALVVTILEAQDGRTICPEAAR